MREEGCGMMIAGVALIAIGFVWGHWAGTESGIQQIHTEAVEQRTAEWVTDSAGESTFRWNSDTEPD